MRELIASTALASPGRTRLYILDEVHMLSKGASAALLKTLEEPPDHVVFILATTDPEKVLPTIRSRTQHLDFRLLPAAELEAHVRWIVEDAGLEVTEEGIAQAMREGGGSARDTLSVLDRIVAAGGVARDDESVDDLLDALCENDTARALTALADATVQGRDPRGVGEQVLERLRNAFLAAMRVDLAHLTEAGPGRGGRPRRAPPGAGHHPGAGGAGHRAGRHAPGPGPPHPAGGGLGAHHPAGERHLRRRAARPHRPSRAGRPGRPGGELLAPADDPAASTGGGSPATEARSRLAEVAPAGAPRSRWLPPSPGPSHPRAGPAVPDPGAGAVGRCRGRARSATGSTEPPGRRPPDAGRAHPGLG